MVFHCMDIRSLYDCPLSTTSYIVSLFPGFVCVGGVFVLLKALQFLFPYNSLLQERLWDKFLKVKWSGHMIRAFKNLTVTAKWPSKEIVPDLHFHPWCVRMFLSIYGKYTGRRHGSEMNHCSATSLLQNLGKVISPSLLCLCLLIWK